MRRGRSISRMFSRRVNMRALLILVVTVVVVGTSVYFVHGFQVRRHAGHFLKMSHQALEEKDYRQAIDQLDRYLQLVPDDSEAMAELGLLLAEHSPNRRAYELLERALLFQPEREDVRRELVDLAVAMGRFSDARDHLEDRLLIAAPDDPELLELLARCQAGQGDYEVAAETLEKAIEADPGAIDYYRYLAELLSRQLEKPEAANRWMERLVEANPDSARAHVLRGDYLRMEEQPDKAAQEAATALELAPDDLDCLWLASRCALDKGDVEGARMHARRGLELDEEEARMYIALSDAEIKDGDRKKAAEWLRKGLAKKPEQDALLRNLVLLMIDSGRADEAQETLDKLRSARLPHALLEYLQARIDLLRGEWKTASDRLEYSKGGLAQWSDIHRDAEYWLGKCYAQLGAADEQLAAYRRAVAIDRMWIPVRLELVDALLTSGKIREAMSEQQKLMRLPGAPANSASRLAWIRLMATRQSNPEDRDWKGVEKFIAAAEKINPSSPQTVLLRAEALASQDRMGEAEKLITDAMDEAPDQVTYWIALSGLYQRQQDWQRAEGVLDDAVKKLGDTLPLRLARARLVVGRDKEEAKAGLDELAEPPAIFSDTQDTQLWRALIPLYLQIGDRESARKLGQQAAAKQPEDLPLRLLLFEMAFQAKDKAGMESLLVEIEKIEGRGPYWHYGQAVRAALASESEDKDANLAKAIDHLQRAAKLRPTWGRVALLAGQLHDMKGEEKEALEDYNKAIELGELNPIAVRRVAQSLYSSERYNEASQLIQRLEKRRGSSMTGGLGRMASDLSLRAEQFDRGLQMAREATEESKDYRDYLWLGQVAGIMGQRTKNEGQKEESEARFTEAEEAFREATKVAPEVPQTWIALIYFLSRTGRAEEATEMIDEAQASIAAEQVPLASAQAYELVGRKAEADMRYDAALLANKDDPAVVRAVTEYYFRSGRSRDAREQLEKIVARDVSADASMMAWARQRLALLLISKPDPERCRRAMSLINENLRTPQASLADRRTKAMVYLADPKRNKNQEALKTMEAIVSDPRSASTEDRFLLARLYLAEGDWPKARRLFQSLAAESRQPRYLAAYVEALISRNEFTNAEVWLRSLTEALPSDFAPVSLRARLELRRGQTDLAIQLLDEYISKDNEAVPKRDDRLRMVGSWLEQYANSLTDDKDAAQAARLRREAEAKIRNYVGDHPEARLGLVAFLMRSGRTKDAMQLAGEIAEGAEPPLIARTSAVLLSGKAASDEKHLDQVEELLRKGIEKYQRPIHLLLVLADVTTRQGRFEETESIYREVLDSQGYNVPALNNLAVLLALRGKDLDEALEMVNRAIELGDGNSTLLDSRATVYLAMGETTKALADLDVAIADAPKATRYFHRAQVHFEAGQKELAREALNAAKLRSLDPANLHQLEQPAYRKMEAELR